MSYSLITYALYPTWLLGPWGFSRQEYWSGLLFPSSADLSDPEMEQEPLMSPALASGFLTTSATWEALLLIQFSSVAQSCPTLCDPMNDSHQAPLSMGFSRQEYWRRLPYLPPGNLPYSGIEPASLMSPALAREFFITRATWEILHNH